MAKTNTATKPATNAAPTNGLAQVAAQVASAVANPAAPAKAAATVRLQAALANGNAAPSATALAHTWGNKGGNTSTAKMPTAGVVTVTAKGQAYQPKPGYNAYAWGAILATLAANPLATMAQLAAAVNAHPQCKANGSSHVNYQFKRLGHLALN